MTGSRWAALAMLVPGVLLAQANANNATTPLGRALIAERNGAYGEAATQYAAILKTEPANLGALTGMEHVLPRLDRSGELVGLVEAALTIDSTGVGVLGVAVRTFALAGRADSARKYIDRWASRAPNDEDPYREWSDAALQARDMAQATLALDLGRQRLGPHALGIERAELLQRAGDAGSAALEWLAVVQATPAFRDGAIGMLAQVTAAQRDVVHAALQKNGSPEARQMLGLLLIQWGDAAQGVQLVRGALPKEPDAAKSLLQQMLDQLRSRTDKASQLGKAITLEAMANLETGAAARDRQMAAASAYADAGDERNARRVLALVGDTIVSSGARPAASTTLLQVLIAEGNASDAERALGELGSRIDADEHDRLARRIAMLWVHKNEFARAGALIAADSSTSGFDLRGRLRLFQGDLAGAAELLKAAGPYDEAQEQALDRVELLALMQAIGKDSLPALGAALLTLERGDSARAVSALSSLASTLTGAGAAETRLLAGRIAVASRDTIQGSALLHSADVKELPATAAEARIELARIEIAAGHLADARALLEQLILDFPDSAVVPEARHLRDTVRGAVPAGT